MSRPLLTPDELTTAQNVAARIGSKWSAVEVDDVTSELYLWLVMNLRTVERWRMDEHGKAKLYVTLRREAAKYCAKEQAVRVGQPLTVGNFYTVDFLHRALPYVFEDTPQSTVQVNPRTGQSDATSGEFDTAVAIMADIRGAYYGLHQDLQLVLAYRYRDGLTYEEIGELRGITKDGAKKFVDRAVSRLSDALAGERL